MCRCPDAMTSESAKEREGDGGMPKTLTDERYAPITNEVGIVCAGIDKVLWQLRTWSESLGRQIAVTPAGEFPQALHALEPLEAPLIRRELLVGTENGWTAYLNSAIHGTDAFGATSMLATLCGCRTFQVTVVTQAGRHGRYGCAPGRLRAGRP